MKFLKQVFHFGFAWCRWKLAGSPTRSPEEIRRLWLTCCGPCVHYHQDLEQCTICNCYVRDETDMKVNKLVYATERCPLKEPCFEREA